MSCGWNSIGCQVRNGIVGGVKTLFDNQLDAIERQVGEAVASALSSLSSFWLALDAPPIATDPGGSGRAWVSSAPVGFLESRTSFIVIALAVVSVIVAGMRMAWESRGESARELLRSLLTLVLVMGCGTAVIQLLATAADSFALWLVSGAVPTGSSFERELGKLVLFGSDDLSLVGAGGLPKLVFIQFAILLFFASLLQIMLMLVRAGMLVLLAGTFPLAAAMTNTEVGRAWFKKHCGWILAFIAYKPAAALIYAAAFRMMQEGLLGGAEDLIGLITGMMLMLMTIFALPALLRLVVPMTAAVAGGSMTAGLGAEGLLPTGARLVGRSSPSANSVGSGGSGGSGGGAGGGEATGAVGVGAMLASAASTASGAARQAGGKLAEAASHSAGEPSTPPPPKPRPRTPKASSKGPNGSS